MHFVPDDDRRDAEPTAVVSKKAGTGTSMDMHADEDDNMAHGARREHLIENSIRYAEKTTEQLSKELLKRLQISPISSMGGTGKAPLNFSSICLFDEAVAHVARLLRVLARPEGHMMLIGSRWVGKTTSALIAAHVLDMTVIKVTPDAPIQAQLKDVYRHAIIERKQVMLLASHQASKNHELLEQLNSFLAASTAMALLWTVEERKSLIQDFNTLNETRTFRNSMVTDYSWGSGLEWSELMLELRRNLRVVICLRQGGGQVQQLCWSYPTLLKMMQIDMYQPWAQPMLAVVCKEHLKYSLATSRRDSTLRVVDVAGDDKSGTKVSASNRRSSAFSDMQVSAMKRQSMSILTHTAGSSKPPPALDVPLDLVAAHMAFVHESVIKASRKWQLPVSCTSPCALVEFASVITELLINRTNRHNSLRDRLEHGFQRLDTTAFKSSDLMSMVPREEAIVAEKKRASEQLLMQVGREMTSFEDCQKQLAKETAATDLANADVEVAAAFTNALTRHLDSELHGVHVCTTQIDREKRGLLELKNSPSISEETLKITGAVFILLGKWKGMTPFGIAELRKAIVSGDKVVKEMKELAVLFKEYNTKVKGEFGGMFDKANKKAEQNN